MPDRTAHARTIDLAELRARTPLAPLIGRRVKLARSGKEWIGCCPFHNERTPSFYVYTDHYHCFGCGAHGDAIDFVMKIQGAAFIEAVRLLSAEAGVTVPAKVECSQPAPPGPAPAPTPHKDVELARSLFLEATPAAGTIVETYLHTRGCTVPRGGVIRFHPSCPRDRERLPAMLAAMTDPVSNKFVGVHRTFLRPDGLGKVEHGDPKKKRMVLGASGTVRLAPDDEITLGLGICEGIETGLTLMQRAGWSAIWAAGNATALAKFPVLGGIECLTLFPDADRAGRDAAGACMARWVEAGREVQTIWPPGGLDWNDALVRRAA